MDNLQLNILRYKPNSYIMIEGDDNTNYFFIIQSGQVLLRDSVSHLMGLGEQKLQKGDFFGVVSCMSKFPRIQTALSLTETTLIAVKHDQFHVLLKKSPSIALKIIKKFSTDLRHFDEYITKTSLGNVKATNEEETLFNSGQYYLSNNNYNFAFKIFLNYLRQYPSGRFIGQCREKAGAIKQYTDQHFLNYALSGLTAIIPPNFLLFSEGEKGDKLYIIQKGKVSITKILDNKEILIAVLKDGDIFGEMALLEDKPRTASAIVTENSSLLVVDRQNFNTMVINQPVLSTKLIELLSERIWVAYRQVQNALISDPMGKLWDMMLIQLQKNRVAISPKAQFLFPFGIKDLMKMIGAPEMQEQKVTTELQNTKKFDEVDGKLMCKDVSIIEKQTEYYRKMMEIKEKIKKK